MQSNNKAASDANRYDRQIRVWGAEAQVRLQNAKILICNLTNLNIEVIKNLVLAGVNVMVVDDHVVEAQDLTNNFFLTMDDLGKPVVEVAIPKIQELNGYVKVDSINQSVLSLPDDFYKSFDVILLSGEHDEVALRINRICREKKAAMFWSDASGEDAIFYSDFGDAFEYIPDAQPNTQQGANPAGSSSSNQSAIQSVCFPPLADVLQMRWDAIGTKQQPLSKTFICSRLVHAFRGKFQRDPFPDAQPAILQLLGELTAVHGPGEMKLDYPVDQWSEEVKRLCYLQRGSVLACSILGSYLSQEVIKAISRAGQPVFNVTVYSGSQKTAVRSIPIAM